MHDSQHRGLDGERVVAPWMTGRLRQRHRLWFGREGNPWSPFIQRVVQIGDRFAIRTSETRSALLTLLTDKIRGALIAIRSYKIRLTDCAVRPHAIVLAFTNTISTTTIFRTSCVTSTAVIYIARRIRTCICARSPISALPRADIQHRT